MKDISNTKLPKVFSKKYTEKLFKAKILKKIHLTDDKKFIDSLFTKTIDETTGNVFFEINRDGLHDKKDYARLKLLAKEIKKQKGRFNFVSIFAALALAFSIFFLIFLLRNYIIKNALVNGMESIFGAKCEVELVDLDILKTRFQIKKLAVANKNAPMKNLFEIGEVDIYFNLLELTRKKFVAENLAITGITWNTDRKFSGALPPKKQKAVDRAQKNKKPNPIMQSINAEIDKVKKGVSINAGVAALKDHLDYVKFFEKQKAALKTPAVITDISNAIPEKTQKWQATVGNIEQQVNSVNKNWQAVAAINVNSITDLNVLSDTLTRVKSLSDDVVSAKNVVTNLTKDIQADADFVKNIMAQAEAAIKADKDYIQNIVQTIQSFDLNTGTKMFSSLFDVFIINTLGTYYPYAISGFDFIKSMQSKEKQQKKLTLKDKVMALERLPGRNIYYANNNLPSLLLRNIALSVHDPSKSFSGGGIVKNITNNADQLGLPISIDLNAKQNELKETVAGVVDLRTASNTMVNVDATFSGLKLSIPSQGTGVPSLAGTLSVNGTVNVLKNNDTQIISGVKISPAVLSVPAFEPKWVFDIYNNIMLDINKVDLMVKIGIVNSVINIDVSSQLDVIIAAAIKKEFDRQINKLKNDVINYANQWLKEQQALYMPQITQFTDNYKKATNMFSEIKNIDSNVQSKQKEVEKAISDFAKKQAKPLTDQIPDALKKFF